MNIIQDIILVTVNFILILITKKGNLVYITKVEGNHLLSDIFTTLKYFAKIFLNLFTYFFT